jgi:hypothetical protein
MRNKLRAATAALAALNFAASALAADDAWVEESNANAQIVLELAAEFNPEGAASFGVDGIDENIVDFRPRLYERNLAASEAVLAELRKRQAAETDRRVH